MPVGAVSNVKPISKIPDLRHPRFKKLWDDWIKWRLTYKAGDEFIDRYLFQFSNREDSRDFQERKRITYCPAFAKKAIHQIRNAIYRKAGNISRVGGPKSYQDAIKGLINGVDKCGSNMNHFMDVLVLDELLVMGVVGVYVDMPSDVGYTLAQKKGKRPYIYMYQAEDILSYVVDESDSDNEFLALTLVDNGYNYDEDTHLPLEESRRTRYLFLEDEIDSNGAERRQLYVKFFDHGKLPVDRYGNEVDAEYKEAIGDLDYIPFHLLDIGTSLLADAANYQIAHMNLCSADMTYATKANFPFYVEPYDFRSQSPYIKRAETTTFESTDGLDTGDPSATTTNTTTNSEIAVGPLRGRRYPTGATAPEFIHPSSEPMMASMKKQEQIKQEIQQLVNLSLASLTPGSSSAESKMADLQGLHDGLGYIAMILQHAENKIATFWAGYEGAKPAKISYPEHFDYADQETVSKIIESLQELAKHSPSITLRRRIQIIIVRLKLAPSIEWEELKKIENEIEKSKIPFVDADEIFMSIDKGLLGTEMASLALLYPEGEAEKAKNDHAERLARIQQYQTPRDGGVDLQARGVGDKGADPDAGKNEKAALKEPSDKSTDQQDPTRGEGK
jgi:hypothetical protein